MNKVFITIGSILGVGGGTWLMLEATDNVLWTVIGALVIVGAAIAGLGLWRFKNWALRLSFSMAFFFLFLGCWLEYITWDMRHLLEDQSTWATLRALLDVRVSVFILVPLIWFAYFQRPRVKEKFQ